MRFLYAYRENRFTNIKKKNKIYFSTIDFTYKTFNKLY